MSSPSEQVPETNFIYIGETISELGLRRNMMVYGNKPPVQILNIVRTNPLINAVYVPTSRCAEARAAVQIEGSLENIAFRATQAIRDKLKEDRERKRLDGGNRL